MRNLALAIIGCQLLLLSAPGVARADDIRQVPTLQMRPSTDHAGVLTVDSANTLGHLRWSAGAQLGFALNPLVGLRNDRTVARFVEHSLVLDLWASLGLGKHFEVGLHLPVVAYHSSDLGAAPVPGGVGHLTPGTLGTSASCSRAACSSGATRASTWP
jgi:hypothetical protein